MRISDWSSDVCSSDLIGRHRQERAFGDGVDPLGERDQYLFGSFQRRLIVGNLDILARGGQALDRGAQQRHLAMHRCQPNLDPRSEEHTSELQSLMRISYAAFCSKNKITQ